MNLETGLWQQQSLKLKMTHELSQAITLLQYSAQELTAFLEEKALDNPLIELEKNNITIAEYNGDIRTRNNRIGDVDNQTNWIEQISDKHTSTLSDYLLSQINLQLLSSETERIFVSLIDYIDENGYLRTTTVEIARQLSVSEALVEETVELLQQLEPAGIGARNLQECLLLQIKRTNSPSELAIQIITNHFVDFAEKNWHALAKQLRVSLKEIQAVFDDVQTLNPKPGATYTSEDCVYLVPDIIVEWDGSDYIVKIVDDHIPAISFNHTYHQQLVNYQNRDVKHFLQEKSRDYNWLLRSLQQRNETLLHVMLEIINKQHSFFRQSNGQLAPLTMKEVADALNIHESTVSRTVREKYVQTPFGTYALKSFFTSTLQTVSAEGTSSAQVKNDISQLINEEDKHKPLSDQKIANKLKEKKGIVISRRTVAKYRDELGIASSAKRKRFK